MLYQFNLIDKIKPSHVKSVQDCEPGRMGIKQKQNETAQTYNECVITLFLKQAIGNRSLLVFNLGKSPTQQATFRPCTSRLDAPFNFLHLLDSQLYGVIILRFEALHLYSGVYHSGFLQRCLSTQLSPGNWGLQVSRLTLYYCLALDRTNL